MWERIDYVLATLNAQTIEAYIKKAKRKKIKEVDVGVRVDPTYYEFEINLTPSLTLPSSISASVSLSLQPLYEESATIYRECVLNLFGRRKLKYMPYEELRSKIKRRGLEKAVEIAERLSKEGFDVVIEGKSIDEMRSYLNS